MRIIVLEDNIHHQLRLESALYDVAKNLNLHIHEEILHYSYQGRPGINIPISDILFIQTAEKSHRLVIYTSEFIKEFYGSLSEILQLDTKNHFQRVDRSAIVNVQNIASYDSKTKEVMFFEGTTCPVSRLRLNTLKIRMKELGIL